MFEDPKKTNNYPFKVTKLDINFDFLNLYSTFRAEKRPAIGPFKAWTNTQIYQNTPKTNLNKYCKFVIFTSKNWKKLGPHRVKTSFTYSILTSFMKLSSGKTNHSKPCSEKPIFKFYFRYWRKNSMQKSLPFSKETLPSNYS